jgi:hypothetical protein
MTRSANYEVLSTGRTRLFFGCRGATISHSCPAPLSYGEGLGVRPAEQGRWPLGFARGPGHAQVTSTSASLGGARVGGSRAKR